MRAKLVNEGAIKPDRELFDQFKELFIDVISLSPEDPFHELNEVLNPLKIALIDFDSHMAALDPNERKEFQKANMLPEAGIRLMGFEPSLDKIVLYVDKTFDDKILRIPRFRLESMLDFLYSGFGHETIHLQQVNRMKVKQDPEFHSKEEYYGNKQEIMAMAFSFVQEMSDFHPKGDILNMLKSSYFEPGPPKRMPPPPPPGMMRGMMNMPMRGGRPLRRPPDHPLLDIYKKLGGKAYKLFLKYAVQYVEDLEE